MTETTEAPTIDEERAEAFAERVLGILNGGALAVMTSVGHEVGLFDTLAELPPATSAEIAVAAGLHERYVREWLGAMAAGGVVEYDATTERFNLPAEHAVSLTRAAGPDNLAIQAQYIGLLAAVESSVAECFRSGGGVPYSEYTDFHRLMAEDSAAVHDAALLDVVVPLVEGIEERLRSGIDVADIGCGSGHAVNLLAQAFPQSRFVGYDFSEEAIAAARREAASLGLTNATFEVRDVASLDEHEQFDLIASFDAIHDQAKPADVLDGIARALRPDGVYLMVDIDASSKLEDNLDHVLGPFLYTCSTMHCMTVSLALGGDGLGTMWGRQKAHEMLADAGFTSVEEVDVEDDLLNLYMIARKT